MVFEVGSVNFSMVFEARSVNFSVVFEGGFNEPFNGVCG